MKSVVVELDDESYQRLCARAKRMGVDPGVAARLSLEEGLSAEPESADDRRERHLAALAALRSLRERAVLLPGVDAAALTAEAKRELEERDTERGWTR